MARPLPLLSTLLLAALLSVGCEKEKTPSDNKAEKEQQWRVRQKQQAAKYYSELVKKYPDSPYAAQAKEKLKVLQPPATPAK